MGGTVWWVVPALILCAVTFCASLGVLLFLAGRAVSRLLWRVYEPAHALAAAPERWVPWQDDPRVGSMQLADDLGWPGLAEVAHEEDWRVQTAHDLNPAALAAVADMPLLTDQLAAVLDLPERLCGPEQPHEKPADTESAGSGHLPEPEPERTWAGRVIETSDEWLQRLMAAAGPGWTYA